MSILWRQHLRLKNMTKLAELIDACPILILMTVKLYEHVTVRVVNSIDDVCFEGHTYNAFLFDLEPPPRHKWEYITCHITIKAFCELRIPSVVCHAKVHLVQLHSDSSLVLLRTFNAMIKIKTY